VSRATERWERGPAHKHQAHNVDVEDALPLGVAVGFDATLGVDARVVDNNSVIEGSGDRDEVEMSAHLRAEQSRLTEALTTPVGQD
jgi:hypothetical protein